MEKNHLEQPRRTRRKTGVVLAQERDLLIKLKIRERCSEGLTFAEYDDKGRGVKTTRPFKKDEFVVEYIGDLLSRKEGLEREDVYGKDPTIGSYMYFFGCRGKEWCIDGTAETEEYGRLINHSGKNPNLKPCAMIVDGQPRLVFFALKDIAEGQELQYDYKDKSKKSLAANPWLAL